MSTGSMNYEVAEGVTVDISKHSGSDDGVIKPDGNGGYYYDSDGGKVLMTESYYPDPEGTYRKIVHTPKSENIKTITHKGDGISVTENLSEYANVSVYYWSLDNTCATPLLIQLGEGNNYYTDPEGVNYWSNSEEETSDLKQKLDEQNCKRNEAHIIKILEKNGTNNTYFCPSCTDQQIKVSPNSMSTYIYSTHSISSSKLSVTGFKENNQDQVGLPSIRDVGSVHVYFNSKAPGGIPLLIHYKQGEDKWYRRNTTTCNTWSEVSQDERPKDPYSDEDGKIKDLIQKDYYYPQITPNISRTSGVPYCDKTADITITVRSSSIGDGYSKFEHSLCGGLFEVKSVNHGTTQLDGITYDGKLESVTAYYYGDDSGNQEKLIMVEVEKRGTSSNNYVYYGRENRGSRWTLLSEHTGKLENADLITQLSQLKTQKDNTADPQKQVIVNAVGGTVGGLVAAGALVALAKVFWPAIVAFFAAL